MFKVLVTGGSGFIGSSLIRHLIQEKKYHVINVDRLTYAGNVESLLEVDQNPLYAFERVDICDSEEISRVLRSYMPDLIMHLAAETHVDRSIDGPAEFIRTNVLGTFTLLEQARLYFDSLNEVSKLRFRFHHISTDEVYGDLEGGSEFFREDTAYAPSSPYAASKASSDHLVRAWGRTYGLPIIITNCSNNYGPYHFPEKLIPHVILNALQGKPLPVYGDGSQIRDWLFVEDHVKALTAVAFGGVVGETYNIGGHNEKSNIDVVHLICSLLEELSSEKPLGISKFSDLITFVKDRPGHDIRYAIDASKIEKELNWTPSETFETGLRKTVQWYLDNTEWSDRVLSGAYRLERVGGHQ